jgi:hypothetical protein
MLQQIRYRPVREYIGKMSICDECDSASHIHEGVVVQRTVTKGKERNIAVFISSKFGRTRIKSEPNNFMIHHRSKPEPIEFF